ncbi:hypothetical protein ACL02U_04830 [Streptomyces sp. MS06]|uniref:hypothetical protein n=1 Tax=Streptomyces sp. MS06 TaxID=3385974 RepID=UPI0039A0D2B5
MSITQQYLLDLRHGRPHGALRPPAPGPEAWQAVRELRGTAPDGLRARVRDGSGRDGPRGGQEGSGAPGPDAVPDAVPADPPGRGEPGRGEPGRGRWRRVPGRRLRRLVRASRATGGC